MRHEPSQFHALARRKLFGLLTSVPRTGCNRLPEQECQDYLPFRARRFGDISSRLFAEHVKDTTGQTLVVENRAGASSGIGAAAIEILDDHFSQRVMSCQR